MVLPQMEYDIVISLLHERELDDTTISDAMGKIRAHEMMLMIKKVMANVEAINNKGLACPRWLRRTRRRRRRSSFPH